MMNETMNTLLQRRSCRAYRPDPVEEEKLQAVLQAGLYAPSAMGRQSVTLVVVQDQALLAELETANAEIRGNPGAKLFYGAPAMVIVLADPEATNAINAQCDGALAMGNMMNAATVWAWAPAGSIGPMSTSTVPRARPCWPNGACRSGWKAWATAFWAIRRRRRQHPLPGRTAVWCGHKRIAKSGGRPPLFLFWQNFLPPAVTDGFLPSAALKWGKTSIGRDKPCVFNG